MRDNYQWYAEWINTTIMQDVGSKELHDYFLTSSIYKNRVISVYQQAYNNYVPMLKDLISRITKLQGELNNIINKSTDY